jgi:hypothetical protein
MNVGARAAREALKKVVHQFRLEISNPCRADFCIDNRGRASPEIDGSQPESFVHGHDEITCAQNAASISQSAIKRLAQGNPHVLDGVVLIHIQITRRCDS